MPALAAAASLSMPRIRPKTRSRYFSGDRCFQQGRGRGPEPRASRIGGERTLLPVVVGVFLGEAEPVAGQGLTWMLLFPRVEQLYVRVQEITLVPRHEHEVPVERRGGDQGVHGGDELPPFLRAAHQGAPSDWGRFETNSETMQVSRRYLMASVQASQGSDPVPDRGPPGGTAGRTRTTRSAFS